MTAKTLPDALAIESARGAEHLAQIRAEGWRAGYAAGLEAAAKWCDRGEGAVWETAANYIRYLDIPETPNG